jgi:chloramphenicol 3-O phosphotransferase
MLLDEHVRDHWVSLLRPLEAIWVGVTCDLAELERRDRERGNRPGLARWSAQRVHTGLAYDMIVETTAKTPISCAQEIVSVSKARRTRVE